MKLLVTGWLTLRRRCDQMMPVGLAGGVDALLGITIAPTLFDATDVTVCQLLRFARAVNVYAVPTVRPVKLQDVAGLVTTHCFEASWVAVMV